MTVLLFVAVSVVVGCLLYLPFFLWFRRHRPHQSGALSARISFTPVGWLLLGVQLVAMFAGIELQKDHADSAFGRLFKGDAGLLKWWVCVVVVFSALGSLLRGMGVALQPPATVDEAGPPADAAAAPAAGRSAKRYKVATIGGIPIFAQRSYLYGGLFIGLIAQAGAEGIAGYCIAYATLFALHEAGHVVAARALGIRVHAVDLSAIGGACLMHVPRRARDAWLVYSAGLAMQVALLAGTWAVVALFGEPESPFGIAVVATFTWVNVLVFLTNLVPGRTSLGIQTDGGMLWGLAMHRLRGAPHPLAAEIAASPVFEPATRLLSIEGLAPDGFRHGIEILNDDTTPMEFVVDVLHRHAGLEVPAATDGMLAIHRRGGMLLPLADQATAIAVAQAIARDAQAKGHPLVCRAVSTGN